MMRGPAAQSSKRRNVALTRQQSYSQLTSIPAATIQHYYIADHQALACNILFLRLWTREASLSLQHSPLTR